MKLFKKKEKAGCCQTNYTIKTMVNAESTKKDVGIKVLGAGCTKCINLEKAIYQAITELQLDLKVEHITDFATIASYGVMTTPALVLNGKVLSYGKVLTVDEIKTLLRDNHE